MLLRILTARTCIICNVIKVNVFSITGIAGPSFLSARAVFVFCVFFFNVKLWVCSKSHQLKLCVFFAVWMNKRQKNIQAKHNKSFPVINSAGNSNNKASIYSGGRIVLLHLVSSMDTRFSSGCRRCSRTLRLFCIKNIFCSSPWP